MRPIFYDTETTGVKADKDHIIEIAAYDPERGAVFETLINPGRPIPKDATAIHNITDAMVASAPSFKEAAPQFIDFCQGEVVLVAHNNDNFDIHFLRAEFKRNDIEMPSWKFFDSLKWARKYRRDLPRHTLQFLREMYGIPENNAHRALDDVKVLHQVYCSMVDDLTMAQAYALLNVKKEILHMPFGKHQGQPLQSLPKSYIQWLQENGALDKPENAELKSSFEKFGLLPNTASSENFALQN